MSNETGNHINSMSSILVVFWGNLVFGGIDGSAFSAASVEAVAAVGHEVVTLSSLQCTVCPAGTDQSRQLVAAQPVTLRVRPLHIQHQVMMRTSVLSSLSVLLLFPFLHVEQDACVSLLYPFFISLCSHPHLSPCLVAFLQKGPGSEKLSGCREQLGEDQWLWDVPSARRRCLLHRWGPQTDPCQMDGSWSPELR